MSLRRLDMRRGILLLPVLLLLAGCPFSPDHSTEPPVKPPSEYKPNTSITNVLFNLQLSYNKRNYTEYVKLLHENFEYVFDPTDVGGELEIPESWGIADEKVSAENLFTNQPNRKGYRCESISLGFQNGADVASQYDETWRKVILSQIQLLVDTRHKDTGEPLRYEALGDKAELHFVLTDELDPDSGSPVWKIIKWEDKPVALLAAKN
jgi:hypothetical protein